MAETKEAVATPAAKKLAELDLTAAGKEPMPKVDPSMFSRQTPLKYRVEVVMKDSAKNIQFDVANGEEAAKFVDSYQRMVETKSPMVRWAIGMDVYSIPMDNILFVKMARPSPQEMINAGTN